MWIFEKARMPKPRFSQIGLEDTPFCHCVSRTMRRAFLCEVDRYSGQSFEHRCDWIEQRLLRLTQAFFIWSTRSKFPLGS